MIKYGYGNPLIETLCEFQFVPSQPWDMTIPGLLYNEIKDHFPEKDQKVHLGAFLRPVEGGIEQHNVVSRLMQFCDPEKKALIQVDTDRLIVNHLRPYPTWPKFKMLILDHFDLYRKVASPAGLNRIALRYINQINFDTKPVVQEYFTCAPSLPEGLPPLHKSLEVRFENSDGEQQDTILLTLRTLPPESQYAVSFLLDIVYYMMIPERIVLDQVPDWLEKAHTTIENGFEACVTEKCRALFKEKA